MSTLVSQLNPAIVSHATCWPVNLPCSLPLIGRVEGVGGAGGQSW